MSRLAGTVTGSARPVPAGRGTDRASDVPTYSRFGGLLREWRQRRRLSQMDLALQAEVSTRHVSFLETGKSRPSAKMVLRLAEELDVPLRDRNQLLLAGGYAPAFGQHELEEPEMGPVRDALQRVLAGHEPYPAVAVDRHWGLVCANAPIALLLEGVADELLAPPINVLRLTLDPGGMAPQIVNLAQWRAHLLERLGRQAVTSGDPALAALHAELAALPSDRPPVPATDPTVAEIAVPLVLRHRLGELSLISTVTTFGTATDITVSELAIESFFPANQQTATALHDAATQTQSAGARPRSS